MLATNGWTAYLRYLEVGGDHPGHDKAASVRPTAQLAHLGDANQLEIVSALGAPA